MLNQHWKSLQDLLLFPLVCVFSSCLLNIPAFKAPADSAICILKRRPSLCESSALKTKTMWNSSSVQMKADIQSMLCNTTQQGTALLIKLRELLVAAVITEPRECHAGRVIKYSRRIQVVSLKLTPYDSSKPADSIRQCYNPTLSRNWN